MNRRVLSVVISLMVGLLLVIGLAAALVLPSRGPVDEAAYIACVGVGNPADIGVCVPPPYPERLPLL